ncbi:MAG: hypothetical protein HZB41_12710 [Ignavibacteriae bacterium]|nr:hypothetical protein [Ignavibacteriota bacterium]
MKKILKYSFLIFMVLGLKSCDSNTINNQNTENYFPINIGNYWIYNTYSLDSYKNKINGTEKRDSIIAERKLELEGKQAFQLTVYRDSFRYDTLFFSIESTKVFMLFDSIDINLPDFGKRWFLIADFSKTSDIEWHIYDNIISNYQYNFLDSILLTTNHNTINGKLESGDFFQYNNKSYKSKLFQSRYDKRLYFNFKFPDNISTNEVEVNIVTQQNFHFTFAENIGLVGIKYDPYSTTTRTNPITSYNTAITFEGKQSDLIKFLIVK